MQLISANAPQKSEAVRENEVGLLQIVSVLWRRKFIVLGVALACALAAGILALFMPKEYQASVLLAPASNQSGTGLGTLESVAARFGGLASLAGISMTGSSDQTSIAIATLKSHELTEEFIRQNDLLPIFYPGKWNSQTRTWRTQKRPTAWLGDRYFAAKVRSVTQDRKTGLVNLKITWTNPKLAAQWANELVAMVNQKLRDQAIRRSQRAISYLQKQADSTNVVELRDSIYALMKTEIEGEMVAKGRHQYALRVIDPAIVPQLRSSPITLLWVLGGGVLGFLVASGVVLVKEFD